MRLRTTFLVCMALATLALGVAAAKPHATETAATSRMPVALSAGLSRSRALPRWMAGLAGARRARPAPHVWCAKPRTLRLARYEDGSAGLICAGHVIARVSVPG